MSELFDAEYGRLVRSLGVASTNSDIITWYESPILAFQDPFRGFATAIPLAGYSSRNDAIVE